MGWGRDDHGIEVVALVSGGNRPAVILRNHRLHGRRRLERVRIQTRDQGIDHLLHAVFERSEQRPRRDVRRCAHFLAGGEHGAAQTAVFRFHVSEARQHGAHAQLRSFAAVNSGEQRIGEQIDHLGTVVAFDHLGNRFVAEALCGGWNHSAAMRIFVRHGKKRREHGGHDLGGHHEHEPVGHHHQLAPGYDVGLALRVVRADELIAQPDLAAEVGSPGLLGEKRIGSGFDQAAVDAVGDEHSTQARAGLEQNVLDGRAGLALFFERVRGREAGDSAADDGDAFHGVASSSAELCCETRLAASAALNAQRFHAAAYYFRQGCR